MLHKNFFNHILQVNLINLQINLIYSLKQILFYIINLILLMNKLIQFQTYSSKIILLILFHFHYLFSYDQVSLILNHQLINILSKALFYIQVSLYFILFHFY